MTPYLILKLSFSKVVITKARMSSFQGITDLVLPASMQIHLSFSLSSGSSDDAENDDEGQLPIKALTGFLQGMGATLTDLQDVIFR